MHLIVSSQDKTARKMYHQYYFRGANCNGWVSIVVENDKKKSVSLFVKTQ